MAVHLGPVKMEQWLSRQTVVCGRVIENRMNLKSQRTRTRRVTHILLNQTNTQQELPNEIWTNSDPLSLPVTEGSFIGFAVPDSRSLTMVTKGINVSPTSERVETYFYQLTASFSEFEGRVLEAARTENSSQFTTQMIPLPLIDVSFSE